MSSDADVALFVERCGRITTDETNMLAGAWAAVEADPEAFDEIVAGQRLALTLPGVREAADKADWAFRGTLRIPGDGALYAPNDPIHGRAINTIQSRAMAIAAGDAIEPERAAAMSAPWIAAMGPD